MAVATESWSLAEVGPLLNVTFHQLNQWDREGLVSAQQDHPRGPRRLAFIELLIVGIIATLIRAGLPLKVIKTFTDYIRANQEHIDDDIDRGESILAGSPGQMAPRLFRKEQILSNETGHMIWVAAIDLLACREQLRAGLAQYARQKAASN